MTLVLAQALDAMGATVTIIDADPNRPILRWRSGQSGSTVEVVGDVTEGSIIRVIREHSAVRQFVLVDLQNPEGDTSSRSDFRKPVKSCAICGLQLSFLCLCALCGRSGKTF